MFSIPTDETPDSPWPIMAQLLESHDELATLAAGLRDGWTIALVLRHFDHIRGGRKTIGTCQMPSVNGSLSKFFTWMLEQQFGYVPTFLVMLDAEWWAEAGDRRREILLFHELLHAGQRVDKYGSPMFSRQTGEPIPAMVAHDVEEFHAVVRRYGAWDADLVEMMQALRPAPLERADVPVGPTDPDERAEALF